jgi:hypothetical protein
MGIGPDRQSAFATEGFAGRVGLRVRGQDGRRRYAAGAVKKSSVCRYGGATLFARLFVSEAGNHPLASLMMEGCSGNCILADRRNYRACGRLCFGL